MADLPFQFPLLALPRLLQFFAALLLAVEFPFAFDDATCLFFEGGFTILQHAEAYGEHPVLVRIHELVERLDVACEVPIDQFDIKFGALRHGSLEGRRVWRADQVVHHHETKPSSEIRLW